MSSTTYSHSGERAAYLFRECAGLLTLDAQECRIHRWSATIATRTNEDPSFDMAANPGDHVVRGSHGHVCCEGCKDDVRLPLLHWPSRGIGIPGHNDTPGS